MGNKEFNQGIKRVKYAVPVLQVHELTKHILLQKLTNEFRVKPPESFSYLDKHESLAKHLKMVILRKIF